LTVGGTHIVKTVAERYQDYQKTGLTEAVNKQAALRVAPKLAIEQPSGGVCIHDTPHEMFVKTKLSSS